MHCHDQQKSPAVHHSSRNLLAILQLHQYGEVGYIDIIMCKHPPPPPMRSRQPLFQHEARHLVLHQSSILVGCIQSQGSDRKYSRFSRRECPVAFALALSFRLAIRIVKILQKFLQNQCKRLLQFCAKISCTTTDHQHLSYRHQSSDNQRCLRLK